jgi:hypothetical protein
MAEVMERDIDIGVATTPGRQLFDIESDCPTT